jgi:hypothetical protein
LLFFGGGFNAFEAGNGGIHPQPEMENDLIPSRQA